MYPDVKYNKLVYGDCEPYNDVDVPLERAINKMKSKAESYGQYTKPVIQFHKLKLAYNMMERYEVMHNVHYNIIVRMRPDSLFIKPYEIKSITGNHLEIQSDWFAVGTRDVMQSYCSLINVYADYYFKHNGMWSKEEYYKLEEHRWNFSPEVQLIEHLMKSKPLTPQCYQLKNILMKSCDIKKLKKYMYCSCYFAEQH